jgi:hypothetical protein
VTDVERLYVTRQAELIGSFRLTDRGPGETSARAGLLPSGGWRG